MAGLAGSVGAAPDEFSSAGAAEVVGTTGFAIPGSLAAPAVEVGAIGVPAESEDAGGVSDALETVGVPGTAGVAGVSGMAMEPPPETGAAGVNGVAWAARFEPPEADPAVETAGLAGVAAVAGNVGVAGTAGNPTWSAPVTWPAGEPGVLEIATTPAPWKTARPKIDAGAALRLASGGLTTIGTSGEAQRLGTCAPVPGMAAGAAPGVPP